MPVVDDSPVSVNDETTAAAQGFFDDFDEAFVTFDGDVIAQRYAEPYLACRADGSSQAFAGRAETGRYFARVVADYRQMGVVSCTYRDVEVFDLGGPHLLATVTWELLDESGSIVVSWRESYLLVVEADRLRVRTSIDFASIDLT